MPPHIHLDRPYQIQPREAQAKLQQQEAVIPRRQHEAQAEKVYAAIEAGQRRGSLRISQFIWLSFGVIEGLIWLRILLKLIAANPNNPFTSFIYGVTELFLWPFVDLTSTPASREIMMEVYSFFVLFVYVLLSVLIEGLVLSIFSRPKVWREHTPRS